MTRLSRIGPDTSKAVFTLHCVDQAGSPLLRVNLRRAQSLRFCGKHAPHRGRHERLWRPRVTGRAN